MTSSEQAINLEELPESIRNFILQERKEKEEANAKAEHLEQENELLKQQAQQFQSNDTTIEINDEPEEDADKVSIMDWRPPVRTRSAFTKTRNSSHTAIKTGRTDVVRELVETMCQRNGIDISQDDIMDQHEDQENYQQDLVEELGRNLLVSEDQGAQAPLVDENGLVMFVSPLYVQPMNTHLFVETQTLRWCGGGTDSKHKVWIKLDKGNQDTKGKEYERMKATQCDHLMTVFSTEADFTAHFEQFAVEAKRSSTDMVDFPRAVAFLISTMKWMQFNAEDWDDSMEVSLFGGYIAGTDNFSCFELSFQLGNSDNQPMLKMETECSLSKYAKFIDFAFEKIGQQTAGINELASDEEYNSKSKKEVDIKNQDLIKDGEWRNSHNSSYSESKSSNAGIGSSESHGEGNTNTENMMAMEGCSDIELMPSRNNNVWSCWWGGEAMIGKQLDREDDKQEIENLQAIEGNDLFVGVRKWIEVDDWNVVALMPQVLTLREWYEWRFDERRRQNLDQQLVLEEVTRVMQELRGQGWFHGDIKLSNVGIDRNDQLRVFDLATLRKCDEETEQDWRVGTPGYWAPEVENGERYNCLKAELHSWGKVIERVMNRPGGSSWEYDIYYWMAVAKRSQLCDVDADKRRLLLEEEEEKEEETTQQENVGRNGMELGKELSGTGLRMERRVLGEVK